VTKEAEASVKDKCFGSAVAANTTVEIPWLVRTEGGFPRSQKVQPDATQPSILSAEQGPLMVLQVEASIYPLASHLTACSSSSLPGTVPSRARGHYLRGGGPVILSRSGWAQWHGRSVDCLERSHFKLYPYRLASIKRCGLGQVHWHAKPGTSQAKTYLGSLGRGHATGGQGRVAMTATSENAKSVKATWAC
jgi:hypothetical protein